MGREFTSDDIKDIICNPVYAGIPPYSAIVTDSEWIAAGVRTIDDIGAEEFLARLLTSLRSAMTAVQ